MKQNLAWVLYETIGVHMGPWEGGKTKAQRKAKKKERALKKSY